MRRRPSVSHTGSLVGEDEVNAAAFERAGVIRVNNITELRDAIRALLRLEEMAGTRLGVITATGAGAIMTTDACEDYGFTLSELPKGLSEKLKVGMPDWVHVGNPIDIWPIGMIGGNYQGVFRLAMTDLLKSDAVSCVLAIAPNFNSPFHPGITVIFDAVKAARQDAGNRKPIAMWLYIYSAAPEREMETIDGVACFDSIEQAMYGLSLCYRYRRIRTRKIPRQRSFSCKQKSMEILLQKGRRQKTLLGNDALALLSAFGIPVVRGKTAWDWDGIEAAADTLQYPLVLKLSGEAFLHKSEWGSVATGLRNGEERLGCLQADDGECA